MTENKEELQLQVSQLIHQDIVQVATTFGEIDKLSIDMIIILVQDINLLNVYGVKYIHNDELNEIIEILSEKSQNSNKTSANALLVCFDYLLGRCDDFKQAIIINLLLKVSRDIFIDSFNVFNVLASSVKELFEYFIKYIFNEKFLTLGINIQIDLLYKSWVFSQQLFHDNEASQYVYKELKKLFYLAIEQDKEEIVLWLYYTPLHYYNSGTSSDISKVNKSFKKEIEEPLEEYIQNKIIPKYNIKPNLKKIDKSKKTKVAFVMQRVVVHSTLKVLFSLISSLMKDKNEEYEFILYDLNFPENGGSNPLYVEEFKKLGIEYIDLHSKIFVNNSPVYSLVEKCIKTREILIEDNIDILVGLHTRVEYIFLYKTRTAPKQIYWYHSSNSHYDIEGIDLRIKHGDFTKDIVKHEDFEFHQFGDIIDKEYLNSSIDKTIIENERKLYPENCLILGTIGRLSKVDCIEYIKLIDKVLSNNSNTIYIAAGPGNIESIKAHIQEENIDRWFFPGQINPHLYGNLIDIWPNTFPHPQGLSTLEIMAKSKPVLTMMNEYQDYENQEKYEKNRTDEFKDYPMVTETYDEYKLSLELLINNSKARSFLGMKNLEYVENNYYNTSKTVNRFLQILEDC